MKSTNGFASAFISKFLLALSDLFLFNFSILVAYFLISNAFGHFSEFVPEKEVGVRILAHFILSILCVLWFLTRLRHYTYRKPFWFELKEIFRTLIIFAILDLALVAFSKWNFSRYLWFITWVSILFLVPIGRILVKKVLSYLGL